MFTNFVISSGYYTDCYKRIELSQFTQPKPKFTAVEERIALVKTNVMELRHLNNVSQAMKLKIY